MPISCTISREPRLITAIATGIIRPPDLHVSVDSLLDEPALALGPRALFDARDALPETTILELAEVAGKARELMNRGLGRIAIVAESRATQRAAKTFSVLARALGVDVEVFSEISDAEAWLAASNGFSDSGEKPLPR